MSANLSHLALGLLVSLLVSGCVATWLVLAVRHVHRHLTLPYEPRRVAPWRVWDVVALMLVFFLGPTALWQASRQWFDVPPEPPKQIVNLSAEASQAAKESPKHPLTRVLLERQSLWITTACVLSAVVLSPIAEELIFRLLLQGWLEAVERRSRRRLRAIRRLPRGLAPIALSSLLFAALHFRTSAALTEDVSLLTVLLGVQAVANAITILATILWLRFGVRATWTELGLVPARFGDDVRTGLAAFLAMTAPVYLVMYSVQHLMPEGVAADPIPLLLLAAALGFVYYRTNRIVPAVALHAAFNATGMLLTFWS